jgi:protein-tyrosine phosphatase
MGEGKRGPDAGQSRDHVPGQARDSIRLCFVCLGNICRSPTAEAVMRHLVKQAGLDDRIEIESAGTGDWHVGETRDRRSREVGERRGIPLGGRARQFVPSDFARFEHVLAMDEKNLNDLRAMAPDGGARNKIRLLRSFDPASPPDAAVPDPYYGGDDGFDHVFDVCQAACAGLLAQVRRELGA